MKVFGIFTLFISTVLFSSIAISDSDKNLESKGKQSEYYIVKSPEDAVNRLIEAYSSSNLKLIKKSLGNKHRFGSNVIDGLQWLGNCLKVTKQCIKIPVEVIETKKVGDETAIAVLAKNLLGAPMSVWFVTSFENNDYKVTGMNTRYECVLKTPEQKLKERKERKIGDYSVC